MRLKLGIKIKSIENRENIGIKQKSSTGENGLVDGMS
jgi:hypothetical protein